MLLKQRGKFGMVILSTSDMFDIKISTLLADYDRETITNLYQPIIGHSALALYFTFWSEAKNQNVVSMSSHEQLLVRMKIATGEFIEARKILEAVGLLKTRLEKVNGINIYHYQLFAPRSPRGFFNDTLLFGLFIQNLGENEANRIKRVYVAKESNEEGEDISSSFNDVFHPDFEDVAFLKASNQRDKMMGRNKSKIDTEFSYEKFFEYLKSVSQINENSLTKKELKEIERLSTLYGIEADIAAEKVVNCYIAENEKGKRVDLTQLNKDLKDVISYSLSSNKRKNVKNVVMGDDGLAAKMKLFETTSPSKVLSYLQNGTKPAQADLNIIYLLANDYKLPNGVINVIVDFVLQMNNNILSKYSVEKVASSVSRENITTAIDAMNYLENSYSRKNKARGKQQVVKEEKKVVEQASTLSEEQQDELIEFFKDR